MEKRKLRIAFFVSRFPSVSETFIIDQITGLINIGYNVDIFSRIRPDCSTLHSEIQAYNLLKKTYYLPKKPNSKTACRLCALKYILTNILVSPLRTFRALRFLSGQAGGFSYKEFFIIMPMIRARYDVIHCHFGHNANMVLSFKKIFPESGFIVMFHGSDILLGLEKGSGFYHELFSYADKILANSSYTKRRLLEFGASDEKTIVHPAGIDLDCFSRKHLSDHKTSDTIYLLTVARLVEEKAIDIGLQAFSKVLRNQHEIKMIWHIVGDGLLKDKLIELATRLGIRDKVIFHGAIQRPEVIRFFEEADLFMLPSISEGLGMVLLEAQAMRIPVISTTAGGIPSAVIDGESAFLVDPGEVGALSERLEFLICNPQLWPAMGEAGRKFVEQKYDARQLNQRLVEIYREILL